MPTTDPSVEGAEEALVVLLAEDSVVQAQALRLRPFGSGWKVADLLCVLQAMASRHSSRPGKRHRQLSFQISKCRRWMVLNYTVH